MMHAVYITQVVYCGVGSMRIATNHVEHDKVLKSIIIKLSMLIIIAFNSFVLNQKQANEQMQCELC